MAHRFLWMAHCFVQNPFGSSAEAPHLLPWSLPDAETDGHNWRPWPGTRRWRGTSARGGGKDPTHSPHGAVFPLRDDVGCRQIRVSTSSCDHLQLNGMSASKFIWSARIFLRMNSKPYFFKDWEAFFWICKIWAVQCLLLLYIIVRKHLGVKLLPGLTHDATFLLHRWITGWIVHFSLSPSGSGV